MKSASNLYFAALLVCLWSSIATAQEQSSEAPPQSAATQFGQRQSRGQELANVKPTARLDTRISSRVQSRINSRIDRNSYNSEPRKTLSAFEAATKQAAPAN